MKKKQDFMRLLLCLGGCMIGFAAWIVVIDPFHHYHAPWFGIPTILEDVVYQTPGNATNLEYNSAIVGSSMTENFRVSWFEEELGWDMMKLSYSGATCNDLNAILNCVYANGRNVEHIVMDLNDYQLTEEATENYVERPEYLYTDNVFDDYRYVYNHDVFVKGLERVLAASRGETGNIETAYTWDDKELFGKEKVLELSLPAKEMLLAGREECDTESVTEQKSDMVENCCQNLEMILPIIKEHPETEYIIFFPPYSMIYWEQVMLEDELEDKMDVYTYAIGQLLTLENVKIYYFQNLEVIEQLDEYRDATHYKPEYNQYIFECIKEGKHQLTMDNYREELQKMYEKARDYDYESLWK